MEKTLGARLKKTAEEVAERLGEAAQTAGERISDLRESQRLASQIRALQRERERCRQTMADLLIRMFDQNTFAEALLRPEYVRVKEIDQEIAGLEAARKQIGAHEARSAAVPAEAPAAPAPASPPTAEGPAEAAQ